MVVQYIIKMHKQIKIVTLVILKDDLYVSLSQIVNVTILIFLCILMMYCTASIIQRYDFDLFVHFNDISCNSQIVTLNMVLDLQ